MRTGVVTGMDGTMALLKWCNHERRVPARELMPLKEAREMLTDGDTDIDDVEIIPDILDLVLQPDPTLMNRAFWGQNTRISLKSSVNMVLFKTAKDI